MDGLAGQFPAVLAVGGAVAGGALDGDIQRALTFVPTYAGVLVRVGAMFLFAPLFGSARIPGPVKAAIAVVLAMCVAPTVRPVAFPGTIYELAAAVAGELMFGLAMGMVMSMVFVAAQWAGEVIGQQLGLNLGPVFDPAYGGASSVVSDMLFTLTLVIFLMLRGHHAMLLGLRESFDALPLFSAGTVLMRENAGLMVLAGLLTACTVMAIKLTAPVLAALLVSDVVLGFLGKTMPQFGIAQLGPSLRSMLGMLVLVAGLVFTSETMSSAIMDSMSNVRFAWLGYWSGLR